MAGSKSTSFSARQLSYLRNLELAVTVGKKVKRGGTVTKETKWVNKEGKKLTIPIGTSSRLAFRAILAHYGLKSASEIPHGTPK
jgi:hypothetical protein